MVRSSGIVSRRRHKGFGVVSCLSWVLAVGFFAYTALELHAASELYLRAETSAPILVDTAQRAGAFLHIDLGLSLACAAFAFSLVPFLLGVRSRLLGLAYIAGALLVLLVAVGAWFFHNNAIALLGDTLTPTPGSASPR